MCIILGMYTWQLQNGEALVTSQREFQPEHTTQQK